MYVRVFSAWRLAALTAPTKWHACVGLTRVAARVRACVDATDRAGDAENDKSILLAPEDMEDPSVWAPDALSKD